MAEIAPDLERQFFALLLGSSRDRRRRDCAAAGDGACLECGPSHASSAPPNFDAVSSGMLPKITPSSRKPAYSMRYCRLGCLGGIESKPYVFDDKGPGAVRGQTRARRRSLMIARARSASRIERQHPHSILMHSPLWGFRRNFASARLRGRKSRMSPTGEPMWACGPDPPAKQWFLRRWRQRIESKP